MFPGTFGINNFMCASGESQLFAALFANAMPKSRKENFGRGDNEIHNSKTEILGCGLGCLEISQTSSNSGFMAD